MAPLLSTHKKLDLFLLSWAAGAGHQAASCNQMTSRTLTCKCVQGVQGVHSRNLDNSAQLCVLISHNSINLINWANLSTALHCQIEITVGKHWSCSHCCLASTFLCQSCPIKSLPLHLQINHDSHHVCKLTNLRSNKQQQVPFYTLSNFKEPFRYLQPNCIHLAYLSINPPGEQCYEMITVAIARIMLLSLQQPVERRQWLGRIGTRIGASVNCWKQISE